MAPAFFFCPFSPLKQSQFVQLFVGQGIEAGVGRWGAVCHSGGCGWEGDQPGDRRFAAGDDHFFAAFGFLDQPREVGLRLMNRVAHSSKGS